MRATQRGSLCVCGAELVSCHGCCGERCLTCDPYTDFELLNRCCVSPGPDPRHREHRGSCQDCGRPESVTIDFLVSTAIWNYVMAGQKATTYTIRPGLFDQRLYPRVEGVGGVVCLECFDRRARATGVSYRHSLVVFGVDCWMGADEQPQMPL